MIYGVNLITLINVKRLDIRFSLLVIKRNLIFSSAESRGRENAKIKVRGLHTEVFDE